MRASDALFNQSPDCSEDEAQLTRPSTPLPAAHQPPLSHTPTPSLLTPVGFVVVVSLLNGLYSLGALAAFMYQKEVLRLSPGTIQALSGLLSLPWGFKFIFGFSIDSLLPKIKRAKHIVLAVSLVRVLAYAAAFTLNLSTAAFFAVMMVLTLCSLYENIVAESMLVVLTRKDNEANPDGHANRLPVFFGCRAAGQLVGGFLGGRLVTHVSVRAAFLPCALLPLVAVVAWVFYEEQETEPRPSRPIIQELEVLKSLVSRPRVLPMLAFVCLLNAAPNFDSLTTFYQTDVLGFTADDLANFGSFATLCYIVGLVLYSWRLRQVEPRTFFLSTNFLLWIVNASFMLVVAGYVAKWGLSPRIFCLLNSGVYAFVAELNFMPVVAIWVALTPTGLEATAITLLTAMINFASNLGVYLGVALMWVFGVGDKDYDRLLPLLMVQNAYLIAGAVAVLCVQFPDPAKTPPAIEAVPIAHGVYDIEFYS